MKLLFRMVLLVFLLSLALPLGVAQAAPPIKPQIFYGEVTIGGVLALDGITVSAEIDFIEYASTTTFTKDGEGGKYVLEVPGEIPDEPGKQGGYLGDAVVLKVSGEVADIQPFEEGKATELDLRVGEVPTQYTLTVDSTVGGSVTEPGEGTFTYNAGGMVDLVASLDAGYAFVNWTGDTGDIDDVDAASTTIIMNGDYSITANFVQITHSLIMAVAGEGTVTPESGTYPEGDMTITATPVSGWEFYGWSTDDMTEIADPSLLETTLTLDKDKTVTATFTEVGVTYYTLTMAVVGEGTVTPDPGTYPEGDMAITATSASGWQFASWATTDMAEIADASSAETTLTLDKDKTVTATFTERIGFTTTLSAGWNLLSTPIKLAADSDALEQIFDAASLTNIVASYRWDAQSWQWEVPISYELSPLEAVYIKVAPDASATAEFIPSGELSQPPSRQLQPGLNLIGPAPALEVGGFPDMSLEQALISIAEAGTLTGYTMVVSPGHNQTPWAYALGMEVKDLLPYKGYWVVMENADTLVGFSTTPIE